MAAVKSDLRIPIERTIRGLGKAVPKGGRIYATKILAYFHGNLNYIMAGKFISSLQVGDLANFEWSPTMRACFRDVDSVLFPHPIDFVDVSESIRKLNELLSEKSHRNRNSGRKEVFA